MHDVGLLLLELQHLALHVGRIGGIGDVERDRLALFLEGAGDRVGDRGAVFGVVMDQRDAVGLGARRLHVGEEVE